MPLHILMPFAVFGAVFATVALVGFIVFLICRYRRRRRTGLLDAEVAGCHNFHSASLLSLDKVSWREKSAAVERSWRCSVAHSCAKR